jgi:hypothetical protein
LPLREHAFSAGVHASAAVANVASRHEAASPRLAARIVPGHAWNGPGAPVSEATPATNAVQLYYHRRPASMTNIISAKTVWID